MRGAAVVAALSTVVALAVAGCGVADLRLPGGAPGGPSYQVTAEFTDVLDLVPQAAVKVNDVTVGSVEKISLSGWIARVRMRVSRDVRLPANATASIRQSSLLGEKFVTLAAPTGQPAQGTLAPGAVIPRSRTGRTAEVEEVLAAFGLLLNGGGLAQLKTISEELTTALRGREAAVPDLLHQLDTFLGGLDAQRADILRAIDALDRFSAHLTAQRDTLHAALDALDPGLTVLAGQREQLTRALRALSDLATVGTRVVNASRDDTLATIGSLRPVLDQLVSAGDNLPKALNFLLAYPFPPNVTGAIPNDSGACSPPPNPGSGCARPAFSGACSPPPNPGSGCARPGAFVNMHLTLDLDGAAILANLLAAPPAGATASAGPGSPARPATPALPGLPGPPGPLSGGSPSPSPGPSTGSGGGSGGCSLIDILTGECLP
jgi:phospholipid/cholesterol/gamma-HCH transport system substrate-binding protein